MRLIPKQKIALKQLKLSIGVLTLGMLIASLYTTYCVFTRREMLAANPRLWTVVIGVYIFTGICAIYYLILFQIYRKKKYTF